MGLPDELRAAATKIDPQFIPSSNEAGPMLAAMIAYVEHGEKFLKAAEGENAVEKIAELLSGEKPDKPEKREGKG